MAKLIVAIMYSKKRKDIYSKTKQNLIKKFGIIDKESKPYNFDKFTKYYQKEMGKGLIKRFISFKKPIRKSDLAEIKLFTAEIEEKYSINNKRQINLDPGYLTKTALVLASFKGASFKKQITTRIFAHTILEFKGNKVITSWHTFPDYRIKENQGWFLEDR